MPKACREPIGALPHRYRAADRQPRGTARTVSSQRAGVVESAFQEAPSERDAAPWATRLARLGNW